MLTDAVSLAIARRRTFAGGSETGSETRETGSSSYESYTGSSSASDSADESALSADEDSNFGSDDIPASGPGAAGAVTAGSAVANPVGHSAELDYTGGARSWR